jgi:hypothetical protein
LFQGRLAGDAFMPYAWYEPPRARPLSIGDFKTLCVAEDIVITNEIYLSKLGRLNGPRACSLFATVGLFVLTDRQKRQEGP